MNRAYWHQKASSWVSASVLVGGMVSALLLVLIYKVDSDVNNLSVVSDTKISSFFSE